MILPEMAIPLQPSPATQLGRLENSEQVWSLTEQTMSQELSKHQTPI